MKRWLVSATLALSCAREVPPPELEPARDVGPAPQGDELCRVIGDPLETPRVLGLMRHLKLEDQQLLAQNADSTASLSRGGGKVAAVRVTRGAPPIDLPSALTFGMSRAAVSAVMGEPVKVLFSGEDSLYLCAPTVGLQLSFDNATRGISDSLYAVTLKALPEAIVGKRTVLPQIAQPVAEQPVVSLDERVTGPDSPIDVRYSKVPMRFQLTTRDQQTFSGTLSLIGALHMQGEFIRDTRYGFRPDRRGLTTLFDSRDPGTSLTAHFDGYHTLHPGDGSFTVQGKTYPVKVLNPIGVWSRVGLDQLDSQLLIDHLKYRVEGAGAEGGLKVDAFGYEVWYRTVVRKEQLVSDVVRRMTQKNDQLNGLLDVSLRALEKSPGGNLEIVEREASGLEGMAPYTKVLLPSRDRDVAYVVLILIPTQFEVNTKVTTFVSTVGGDQPRDVKVPVDRTDLRNGVTALRQVLALPKDPDGALKFTVTVTRSAGGESVPLRIVLQRAR